MLTHPATLSKCDCSLHHSNGATGRVANRDVLEIPNPNPEGVVTNFSPRGWRIPVLPYRTPLHDSHFPYLFLYRIQTIPPFGFDHWRVKYTPVRKVLAQRKVLWESLGDHKHNSTRVFQTSQLKLCGAIDLPISPDLPYLSTQINHIHQHKAW